MLQSRTSSGERAGELEFVEEACGWFKKVSYAR
jgi:hypothetical protein